MFSLYKIMLLIRLGKFRYYFKLNAMVSAVVKCGGGGGRREGAQEAVTPSYQKISSTVYNNFNYTPH